jgi:hypothetical protein
MPRFVIRSHATIILVPLRTPWHEHHRATLPPASGVRRCLASPAELAPIRLADWQFMVSHRQILQAVSLLDVDIGADLELQEYPLPCAVVPRFRRQAHTGRKPAH